MPLTRSFNKLLQRHVAAEPAFAEALLREGVDTMLAGDVDTGKAIPQAGEIVRLEKHLGPRAVPEFRQDETAEQSSRSPRKPLMDGDNRPIILLNLPLKLLLATRGKVFTLQNVEHLIVCTRLSEFRTR
jgi:hypothetical protein